MDETPARILYIDDDEGLRRLTRRALERRGYAVELAASGAEGIARAAAERFDLVAVDHYMPGQDGLATLIELRTLPEPPPVIYVTGSEESRIAVAALKAGAIDYIVKTIDEDFFDLLARAVEQALEAVRMKAAKERAEQELRESNAQLQMMLDEVNHRVANSLQLVSAFVHLQARNAVSAEAKVALKDTQRRIAAVGQVHKRLYASGAVTTVDMSDYLGALLRELEEACSTGAAPRRISFEADRLSLPIDKAVPLGIIVNELVSNACKYAYPADAEGEVRVRLQADGANAFLLNVQDDGCGMPADGSVKGTGLGSQVIAAMARSLKGVLSIDSTKRGLSATLVVK
ncbi:MAG: response regulator [Sphingomonadaceae bacterium]|nr:response regulator [Sphingomonadaceae bacterium]